MRYAISEELWRAARSKNLELNLAVAEIDHVTLVQTDI
jgi:hypothetical protein